MSELTAWRGFADRVLQGKPSMTMAIADRAKELKSQGVDVVDLSAGEPDFDTPPHIIEAAIQAMKFGQTRYTKNVGIDKLRKAVCEKFRRDNKIRYNPDQIIISSGGKHVLFNAMMAALNPGDEIIIFAPYWVTFPEMAKLAGAKPVFVEARESQQFAPNLDQVREAVTDRTKAILVNSPGNPTGAVYAKDVVNGIYDIAREAGLFVISDECYDRVSYGEIHTSPAVFEDEPELVITVQSVSKPYAMTGWRIGFGGANREVIKQMAKIQSQSTSNANSVAQHAAVKALTGDQSFVGEMVEEYRKRRDFLLEEFKSIPEVTCTAPQGAFYLFPRVEAYYGKTSNGHSVNTSLEMSQYLLEEANVAVVPGGDFGADNHIRLSYATSMQELRRGMERMQSALGRLN